MNRPPPVEVEETVARNGTGRGEPIPAAENGATDEAVSGGGPGALGRRVLRARTLVSFAIAAAILVFFWRRLEIDPSAVWRQVRGANPWVYAVAFAVWYGSFFLRAFRWRRMLTRVAIDPAHGYPVPGTTGMVELLLLSWFANCVVPARLGDAYRSHLLKQASRASFSTGLGTIVAERLIDLTMLFLTMSGVGVLVFHGRIPTEATQTFAFGLTMLVAAAGGLTAMWLTRHALQRRLPARVRAQYGRLHEAVFRSLRRPELFLAISAVIWLSEGLRLLLVAWSLGADVSLATAMFVALMGSLLTALPVTPAGLGVVEGATIAVLVTVIGMEPALAGSIALLDRVIGYWSIVAVGCVLYVRRAHRGAA